MEYRRWIHKRRFRQLVTTRNQSGEAAGNYSQQQSSSYLVMNLSVALSHNPWRVVGYVTNHFDGQEILGRPILPDAFGGLTNDFIVNRRRETGVRIGYTF